MNKHKLLERLKKHQKNVRFNDFLALIKSYEFQLIRINGSHHIFEHSDISEMVNAQNDNGQAKPYQIKQFLAIIEKYNLRMEDD